MRPLVCGSSERSEPGTAKRARTAAASAASGREASPVVTPRGPAGTRPAR